MTPYHFRLPETFRPGEFLRSPRLRTCHDDARYFVSLILTKLARGDVDDTGRVRLMAKHLRRVMNFRYYSCVVDALLERGAVTRTPYLVGEQAFGYMLADRFREDRHVRIPVTDPRLIGRLESYHKQAEQERLSRMKPVHTALECQQRRLRIDGDLAREIITRLPPASNPFDVQGILVADIEDRQFRINVGRYGRVANNITSMKRELRAALRIGDYPLHHVDISCCQPALIGKAARDRKGMGRAGTEGQGAASIYDVQESTPTKSDLDDYCQLVQSGEFYDYLRAQLETRSCLSFTRDELKRRFLADVIAKKKANDRGAEYPSAVEDCFRAEFPTVYRFIRDLNRNGFEHANLIRELQRQESRLVIETVAADLLARFPQPFLLTLHDAIFTAPCDIPEVVCAFDSAFHAMNFPMTLKVAA
jgi:hypothetical protein